MCRNMLSIDRPRLHSPAAATTQPCRLEASFSLDTCCCCKPRYCGLRNIERPRYVGLCFALGKLLYRFLPLVRCESSGSSEFHTTGLRTLSAFACTGAD